MSDGYAPRSLLGAGDTHHLFCAELRPEPRAGKSETGVNWVDPYSGVLDPKFVLHMSPAFRNNFFILEHEDKVRVQPWRPCVVVWLRRA